MFYAETEMDRRLREVDKQILTEHGVTHPRATFFLYTCPRPAGDDGGYVVDEVPVARYAKGRRWWPFEQDDVRLAPDTARYSWYCEYIGVRRGGRAHVATARFTVHIPKPTGGGSFGVATQAQINLRDQTVTVLNDDLTGELYEQATGKAGKALTLLVRGHHRCRTGMDGALTIDELLAHHTRDDSCES